MRALVFEGDLKYRTDYPAPAPLNDEALVRVTAAGVCATDLEIIKGYMGFKGVLGHEFVGVVEECGEMGLTGRRVAGEINIPCGTCRFCKEGLGNHCPSRGVLGILNKDGAFAEYLTLPFSNLHVLPDSVTDEEAIFVEPLAAAFEIMEQAELGPSKNVCVLGDGRLGILVAQALSLTKCRLVAAGRHRDKLSILYNRGINARIGIDGLGREFDLVVDCTGSPSGLADALKVVRPRGTVVLKTTVADRGAFDLNQAVIDEITVVGSRCGPFKPAIRALEERVIEVRPLVTKTFPIDDGVEAIKYASQKGVLKVILKIGG